MNDVGVIVAQIQLEKSEYEVCPVVVVSNHPRFKEGSRFDYGFLRIALDEGYSVLFIGTKYPERMKLWKDGSLNRGPL